MERKHLIIEITLGVAVLVLASLAWSQSSELERLDDALARVEARVDAVDGKGPTIATARSGGDNSPGGQAEAEVVPVRPGVPAAPARDAPFRNPEIGGAESDSEFDAKDPAVRGQLREVIHEEQEIMRAERRQERQERREQRLRQQVNELAERTEMDPEISEQLTDLLVVEQVEAMELFSQAREDFSWDEAREKVTTLRTETDEKARDLLEDEEFVEYEKLRQQELDRWGRGSGRSSARGRDTQQGDNREKRR